MIKQYIKLAIRNLLRKKLYTVINLTGLTIASAFAILIALFIVHENRYDRFHANASNIYRLELSNYGSPGKDKSKKGFFSFLHSKSDEQNQLYLPTRLPEDIKQNFPEVKSFTRLKSFYNTVFRANNQAYAMEAKKVVCAEKNFFQVFSFPLVKGDASTVLDNEGIVINETTAARIFGSENPIGKSLDLEKPYVKTLVVAGVMKDFPASSSMQFSIVLPVQADRGFEKGRANGQFNYPSLIELQPNTDVTAFEKKLDAFCRNYFAESLKEIEAYDSTFKSSSFHAVIRPLAESHYNASNGWYHYTDMEKIYQLAFLTLLIGIIVCINYVLLTLTNTVARSQEVGVRKTIGAGRKQIVLQFWVETQLLVLLSAVAGFYLAKFSVPFFNSLTGATISFNLIPTTTMIGILTIVVVGLGILAGVYPALAMSGLKPLKIMRGQSTYKLNPKLSKVFVVLQFSACIILVVSSLVVGRQMKFLLNKDLGFDKEQVLMIETPDGYDPEKSIPLRERFYNYAAADPAIAMVTATTFRLEEDFNTRGHRINGENVTLTELPVDFNYFDFAKIPIIKGRSFSPVFATDTSEFEIPAALVDSQSSRTNRALVINETLYNMLGQPPMDEISKPLGGRIVGVCKDYHYRSLTQKIGPAYHTCHPDISAYFWVRIKPGQPVNEVVERVRSNWNKMTASAPFDYVFLDETVQRAYETNERWLRTVSLFSWLAVFIACLGLFGLSGINTMNKTKEIGIRKIMGASVPNLFLLLNKDFIRIAIISFAIAIPVAAYFVHEWLSDFAYRIHVGWSVYVLAAAVGLVSAAIAVSYHTLKAAVANPVNSLKSE
jgi:putative ABC transport system permease protein